MVKTYPRYVSRSWRLTGLLQWYGIHLLVPGRFPPLACSMQLPMASDTQCTIPTSHLVLVGNAFTSLVSECTLHFMWMRAIYIQACSKDNSHKHISKIDSFYNIQCDGVSQVSHQISYWIEFEWVHPSEMHPQNGRTMTKVHNARLGSVSSQKIRGTHLHQHTWSVSPQYELVRKPTAIWRKKLKANEAFSRWLSAQNQHILEVFGKGEIAMVRWSTT